MAIKKLDMINVVCRREQLNEKLRALILTEKVEFIDTFLEINEGDFNIGMSEENADEILDMEDIYPLKENKELKQLFNRLEHTLAQLDMKPRLNVKWVNIKMDQAMLSQSVDAFCCKYAVISEEIESIKRQMTDLKKLQIMDFMKLVDVDMKALLNMEFFTVKLGFLTREKAKRISQNYDHIKAIVLHLGTHEEKELYMIISPKSLDVEMGRILRSTDFMEIYLPESLLSTPNEMIKTIKIELDEREHQLESLHLTIKKELKDHREEMDALYTQLFFELKVDQVRTKVAVTENLAYFSAWIPRDHQAEIVTILNKSSQTLVEVKGSEDVNTNIPIPTHMKNHFFFRPFETLVTMYGVPSHNELDPTPFFAIAYMFLFGAMFGDLGQGIVIAVAGALLQKIKKMDFGGILTRIGFGSMAFGVLYDSFFGYEHVISKFLPNLFYLRPIDNINTMLIASIIVGLILVFISYIYSIINKWRLGDIEEGIFGRNGVNGLILLGTLISLVTEIFLQHAFIPIFLYEMLIGTSLILLLLRQPLSNALLKRDRLYDEAPGAYYVESGFDLLETLLSFMSNTISFIRIGAFALNHVGLFIAFHTLANMIGGSGGSISMFLLGNVIIIGLEGLVVFIQGLRLFYYELFSKYYSGEGTLFSPEKF